MNYFSVLVIDVPQYFVCLARSGYHIDSWDEEEETYMDLLIKSEYAVNYYESSYKEKDKLDVMFDNGEILKINEYISLSFKKSNISFYNLSKRK